MHILLANTCTTTRDRVNGRCEWANREKIMREVRMETASLSRNHVKKNKKVREKKNRRLSKRLTRDY